MHNEPDISHEFFLNKYAVQIDAIMKAPQLSREAKMMALKLTVDELDRTLWSPEAVHSAEMLSLTARTHLKTLALGHVASHFDLIAGLLELQHRGHLVARHFEEDSQPRASA